MAKKRRSSTKTRTIYRAAPKKRRSSRRNSLNASVKKKTAGIGTAVALSQYVIPLAVSSVQSKNLNPFISAFSNKDTLLAMGKSAIGGYAVGYAAGLVLDKTGLKRPVNKVLKKVF